MKINGIWLPIITPFKNDQIDFVSLEKIIDHYINLEINGLVVLGTTGESPVINNFEFEELIEKSIILVNKRVPIFIGAGGNFTDNVIKHIKVIEKYKADGILSVSPYYNKPNQEGIYSHFKKISEQTDMNIILYNNPSRTGTNIENSTVFKLSELKNIIGIKDSSGNISQTADLLMQKKNNFSVMIGDDSSLFAGLIFGAEGGIIAAAHARTKEFIDVYQLIKNNDHKKAFPIWKDLTRLINLLFSEPNPSPMKYVLFKSGLITSPEVRLPLVEISKMLKDKIDIELIYN